VALYAYDGGVLSRTDSATIDVVGAVTTVTELLGKPSPALVLVNDDDLTYAKVRLDPHSLVTALSGLDRMADPMARSLIWSSVWNSVRDGVLGADDYVRAVGNFAAAEDDIAVLQSLADNARFAVSHFTPATLRGELRAELLDAVVRLLDEAPAGSDQQLVWARTLALLGRADASAAPRIRGLLEGREVPAGLTMDAQLRWAFWQALAAGDLATDAELDAELAVDTTAATRASRLVAGASRPSSGVKAEAWRQAVEGTALTNELLSATIEGFTVAGHELLDPYVEPYFDAINGVWAGRSIEIASRIVRGLFPISQDLAQDATPSDHPVVRRTDAWLEANAEAASGLRRIILEQRDHLVRALTAQQFLASRKV